MTRDFDREICSGPAPFGSRGGSRSRLRPLRPWHVAVAAAMAMTSGVIPALGQQTEITISMAPPPPEPRINGPRIVGWRPGTPFHYTIAATGEPPLTFAATLPSGFSIDPTSGTITGTTPAAGSYAIDVTVTNGSGSATATLTLLAGDTLALTPPMGWNSYDSYYGDVTEAQVRQAADAMRDILQPFGWNTVVIDYLWYHDDNTIDEFGRYLPDDEKFPNANGPNGFTPIADYVHDLGMNFGIHLMRGIPRNAFTQNTPILDSSYSARDASSGNDACPWDDHMWGVRGDTEAGQAWYDSIYRQYAEWGVDFVKVDDMMNPYGGNVVHDAEVEAVHEALYGTDRSIVLSLSPGPHPTSAVQVLNANANMWRTVNDFWDTDGLSSMDDEFEAAHAWAETDGITPGHWPDADMLPLGDMGHRVTQFNRNQQVTVMTLWSIMPSPLMFGGIPNRLPGDDWTIALLTNDEVLAVNQDALGRRGRRLSQNGSTEVWSRDLADGGKAVAFFNRGGQDATISVSFSDLGVVEPDVVVRDLWRKQELTGATSEISASVPYEGALLFTVTHPVAPDTGGAGGAGGSAGMASTAGAPGAGGTPTGGTSTSGGMPTGGTSATGGALATGGTPTGGTSATGGTSTMGGTSTGGTSTTGGTSAPGGTLTGGSAPGGTGGTAPGVGATGGGGLTGVGGGTVLGGTTTAGGTTSSGGAPGAEPGTGSGDEDGGCSCRLGARSPVPAWGLMAFATMLLARARRRRAVRTG